MDRRANAATRRRRPAAGSSGSGGGGSMMSYDHDVTNSSSSANEYYSSSYQRQQNNSYNDNSHDDYDHESTVSATTEDGVAGVPSHSHHQSYQNSSKNTTSLMFQPASRGDGVDSDDENDQYQSFPSPPSSGGGRRRYNNNNSIHRAHSLSLQHYNIGSRFCGVMGSGPASGNSVKPPMGTVVHSYSASSSSSSSSWIRALLKVGVYFCIVGWIFLYGVAILVDRQYFFIKGIPNLEAATLISSNARKASLAYLCMSVICHYSHKYFFILNYMFYKCLRILRQQLWNVEMKWIQWQARGGAARMKHRLKQTFNTLRLQIARAIGYKGGRQRHPTTRRRQRSHPPSSRRTTTTTTMTTPTRRQRPQHQPKSSPPYTPDGATSSSSKSTTTIPMYTYNHAALSSHSQQQQRQQQQQTLSSDVGMGNPTLGGMDDFDHPSSSVAPSSPQKRLEKDR